MKKFQATRFFEMKIDHISKIISGKQDGTSWVWHLKRNISIAPSHMAFIFISIGAFSLLIGVVFYLLGASLVLPFSILEVTVLLIAYFYNAIHATDYEKLTVDENVIKIESQFGFKKKQVQLVRSLTRIDTLSHQNEIVQLRQGLNYVFFGKFVHANLRPSLAIKISERLQPWQR